MNQNRSPLIPGMLLCAALVPVSALAQDAPAGMMQPMPSPMMANPYGQMPMMPRGYAGKPGMRQGCEMHGKGMQGHKQARGERHKMMQAHRQNMEERLARIEALLQQLVDAQQPQ